MTPGIDTSRFPPGTKFVVRTKNHTYTMEKLDYGHRIRIEGGKYFPTPTEASFAGSSFSGSCIRIHWIGFQAHMEFFVGVKSVVTTGVQEATVKTPTYEYTMDWSAIDGPGDI